MLENFWKNESHIVFVDIIGQAENFRKFISQHAQIFFQRHTKRLDQDQV